MDPRIPPMQALRAFEAVARTGSLTKAAEGLHLTHGAISHQLKGLEEDLGVRLTERAGRGIRLTDEGARFATRVRVALSELAEAVREVTEHSNPRQFRVSVMPSFATAGGTTRTSFPSICWMTCISRCAAAKSKAACRSGHRTCRDICCYAPTRKYGNGGFAQRDSIGRSLPGDRCSTTTLT